MHSAVKAMIYDGFSAKVVMVALEDLVVAGLAAKASSDATMTEAASEAGGIGSLIPQVPVPLTDSQVCTPKLDVCEEKFILTICLTQCRWVRFVSKLPRQTKI